MQKKTPAAKSASQRSSGKLWTRTERLTITEYYTRENGLNICANKLPSRTRKAIVAQASLLGLTAPRKKYTSSETALLTKGIRSSSTRSPQAIRTQASRLGVQKTLLRPKKYLYKGVKVTTQEALDISGCGVKIATLQYRIRAKKLEKGADLEQVIDNFKPWDRKP